MASEYSQPTASGVLSFLGVATVLFVVTIIAIGLLRILGTGGETLEQRRAASRITVRNRLDMEAQEKLHSDGWVDKAKGIAHVSITDAIPLTVAELRSKKPAPSQIKVEPPLPVFLPDPNSKEPPLPAMPSAPAGAHTMRFTPLPTPDPAAPGRACAPRRKATLAPAGAPAPAAPPRSRAAPRPQPPAPAPPPCPLRPQHPRPHLLLLRPRPSRNPPRRPRLLLPRLNHPPRLVRH